MIRMVELFAGIGAQASALERLGIPHERVAVCEFDDRKYRGYFALHGDTPNLGDITKVEHLPACDLLTYSSPCQDISIAGHKAGLKKGSGTRSATLWDVGRLLDDMREREVLPEVLLMENVDSITFKHARPDLDMWIGKLESLGYTNSWRIINAKDHGIPQNRKRFFMVSTRTKGLLVFPKKRPLGIRLKDMLETSVPESYYLSKEQIETYESHRIRHLAEGHGFGWRRFDPEKDDRVAYSITSNPTRNAENFIIEEIGDASGAEDTDRPIQAGVLNRKGWFDNSNRVYDPEGICPTITAGGGGGHIVKIAEIVESEDAIRYPCGTRKGWMEAHEGDGLVMERTHIARGTVQKQISPTITCGRGGGSRTVVRDGRRLRIRYLTPRECLRLMGQRDDAIDRLMDVEKSKTQLYKMAGDSIVVDVLEDIFRAVYIDDTFKAALRRTSLDYYSEEVKE